MYFPYVGKLPEDFNAELVVAFETLKTGGVGEFVDGEQVFVWSVTERAYHTDGTAGSTEVVVEVVLENAVVAQEYSDTVYQEGEPFFWNSAYFSQFGEADIFEILLYSDRGDTLVETSAPGPGDDDSKEDMLTWILVGVVCGLVFLAGIEGISQWVWRYADQPNSQHVLLDSGVVSVANTGVSDTWATWYANGAGPVPAAWDTIPVEEWIHLHMEAGASLSGVLHFMAAADPYWGTIKHPKCLRGKTSDIAVWSAVLPMDQVAQLPRGVDYVAGVPEDLAAYFKRGSQDNRMPDALSRHPDAELRFGPAYIVYRRRKDVGLVVDPADEEEDLKRGGRRVGIDIDKLAAATAEVDVPEVISALVSLLDSRPELAVRDKALQELATITEEKDAAMQRAAVVKAGAVPHLMSIIDSTASWVPNMSTTLRVPAKQEGINLHIGGLLNSSLKREAWKDPQLQEMFRAVLQLVANITLANPVNQKALQMQGVPTRLVQLLLTLPRDHELRPSAIKAFNHVLNANQKYEEKEALVQAGCLAALIPSLESHTEAVTKLHTVEAINKVVAQHPELCREFLVHTRGLPLLVRLLDPKLSPKALLKHVVGTLMSMTRKEPRMRQAVCRGGAVEALLKLIDPKMDAVVVERASWTLNNLAVSNDAVQDAVREAGGIQTLIDMLERNTSSKSATKAALAALCHLAENPSNRDVVREANGVAVLVKHADYGASSRDVALMALQAVIKNNQMNLDELLELGGKRLLDEMEIMTPSLPNAPGLAAPPSPVAGAREAGGVFADELLAPDPEPQELLVRDEAGVKAPEEAIEDGAPSTAVFESPLMKPMDFLGDTV
eukprot:gene18241-21738_t